MGKGYWITLYRSVSNPGALAAYGKVAGAAIEAGGGRLVVRGTAAKAYEAGLNQRCVVIEFDSLEKAIATYEARSIRRRGSCSRVASSETCGWWKALSREDSCSPLAHAQYFNVRSNKATIDV